MSGRQQKIATSHSRKNRASPEGVWIITVLPTHFCALPHTSRSMVPGFAWHFIGQPVFLGILLLLVALWMLANAVLRQFGMAEFDPGPFF